MGHWRVYSYAGRPPIMESSIDTRLYISRWKLLIAPFSSTRSNLFFLEIKTLREKKLHRCWVSELSHRTPSAISSRCTSQRSCPVSDKQQRLLGMFSRPGFTDSEDKACQGNGHEAYNSGLFTWKGFIPADDQRKGKAKLRNILFRGKFVMIWFSILNRTWKAVVQKNRIQFYNRHISCFTPSPSPSPPPNPSRRPCLHHNNECQK